MCNATAFTQENILRQLLENSADSLLQEVLNRPEQYQLQLIYTQIDRDAANKPSFTSWAYNVDPNLYFYPASTVKMPAAFLALEKLNELRILGLDKNTNMQTGAARPPQTAVSRDTSAEDGLPSIAHYIKKIFLVSDNDAYNRLYEFLGQEYLNRKLNEKGYGNLRIIHRLSAGEFDVEGNRYTNPVSFYKGDTLLYHQGEVYSAFPPYLELKEQVRGVAYLNGNGEIVPEPFDFRFKNYVSLHNLHDILKAVIFPEAVPAEHRFNLSEEDYRFLRRYLSMLPRESDSPAYPGYRDWDSYVKFFLFGDSKEPIPDHIRIFNKVGDAYGFLTDVAYVVDFKNKVEFLLAANIHVNKNQTYNDGVYEYDEIGLPVLARLGRMVYEYELGRERAYVPDLSGLE
ncbi:MAG: serine hydrolase [Phaeodactylibacter sp.]|nr:serine hydrolase [Phaeodactylibacter sp.]